MQSGIEEISGTHQDHWWYAASARLGSSDSRERTSGVSLFGVFSLDAPSR